MYLRDLPQHEESEIPEENTYLDAVDNERMYTFIA